MSIPSLWEKYKGLIVKLLWLGLILGIVLFSIVLISISKSDLPSFEELENPQTDEASVVFSENETAFGRYYIENRIPVEFEEIPKSLVEALISTEDARFYKHSGIDFRALSRVLFKTVILQQDSGGGGSTITQQLSKLLFKRPSFHNKNKLQRMMILVKTKFKEWMTAVKLEKHYTKEEILSMYLNKFEFINGAHGIYAASNIYFSKPLDSLKTEEMAVLVGMLKNPSLYNPVRFKEKSLQRRNVVLHQMQRYGSLDKKSVDSLKQLDLDISHFNRATQSEGPAPYFRSELTKWLKDLLAKEEFRKPDGSEYNIYTDGLKIYTTINLDYQQRAEEAVFEHMAGLQERYFKRWKEKDIFTYGANRPMQEIRREAFDRRVRNSERYQLLYHRIMDESFEQLEAKFPDIRTGPLFIRYMVEVAEEKSSFKEMVSKTVAHKDEEDFLTKVLKSDAWDKVQKNYELFRTEYEKQFNTPIKMMVFAYNEDGEKEVEMTPLDSVLYHYQHMQTGMVSMEPGTGYIKSWVGGVGHKYFKYDHINSRRQVGSTIKPFVYAAAIAFSGISPCQTYDDVQYTIAPGSNDFDILEQWSPANAEGRFSGSPYNLYQGLLYSKNSITVRLVKEMGSIEMVRDLLDNVGISKELKHPNGEYIIPKAPALSLGALDLTVKEMTGAYGSWSNNGTFVEPTFVLRIEDKNGKVIYSASPLQKLALNPVYNSVMVDMLKNNVRSRFASWATSECGGKTGTTNDFADGWFMGITPTLVVGTWVGGDDKWIRFYSLAEGQGSVMARPIFKYFVKRLEADSEEIGYDKNARFPYLTKEAQELINCERYKKGKPDEESENSTQEKTTTDLFDEEEFDEEFDEDFE